DDAEADRNDRRGSEAPPRAQMEIDVEKSRRVGAGTDEQRVAEVLAAGEPRHEVPARRPDAEAQRDREHADDVAAAEQLRRRGKHREREHSSCEVDTELAHGEIQNAARLPKKPAGRRTRVMSTAATETICDHSIETLKAMMVSE